MNTLSTVFCLTVFLFDLLFLAKWSVLEEDGTLFGYLLPKNIV